MPLFLGCVLFFALFFSIVSLLNTKEYVATARIAREDQTAQTTLFRSSTNPGIAERTLANEIIYATGDAVRNNLGPENQNIRIEILKDQTNEESDVLLFQATATSPEKAAADANLWAQSYVETKNQQQLKEFDAAIQDLENELAFTTDQSQNTDADLGLEQSIVDLRTTISQLKLAKSLGKNGPAQVIQMATPPTQSSTIGFTTMLLIGIVFGAIVAVASTLVADYFDTTIRRPSDLEDFIVPVIAAIPPPHSGIQKKDIPLCTVSHRDSQMAEHYFKLRSTISHIQQSQNVNSLVITSPNPGEGKTSTALNLALSMSYLDKRVVLLDTNIRNPQVHATIGSHQSPGLTEFLSRDSEVGLKKIAVRLEALNSDLIILPAGKIQRDTNDVLASVSFSNLLKNLSVQSDLSVLDSPHLTSEALTLASKADATLLTVFAGKTSKADVEAAVVALTSVGATIVGICLVGTKETSLTNAHKQPSSSSSANTSKDAVNLTTLPQPKPIIDLAENV